MINIKIQYPKRFEVNQRINIYINDILYIYRISAYSIKGPFYLFGENYPYGNDIIFKKLNINPEYFMNYFFNKNRVGVWPEVDTLDLLKEQLKYIEHYDEY